LARDPRVPAWIKVGIPLLVAIYFVSPVDLIPDFIIGPGQLDDLGVILLGMNLMVRFSPDYVVDEHRRAMGIAGDATAYRSAEQNGQTIDGDYRVVPPES
jgi:uncharacterized membrane protein YkvA (DUF1232 family)